MKEMNETTKTGSQGKKGLLLSCLCCCLVCVLLLSSVSWSWFNDMISASFKMNTATYDISIQVVTDYGVIAPSEENEYVYNLEANTQYTVTVTTSGTATKGYFDMVLGNRTLTSGNLVNGQITFNVNTGNLPVDMTMSPYWGTREKKAAMIANNGSYNL